MRVCLARFGPHVGKGSRPVAVQGSRRGCRRLPSWTGPVRFRPNRTGRRCEQRGNRRAPERRAPWHPPHPRPWPPPAPGRRRRGRPHHPDGDHRRGVAANPDGRTSASDDPAWRQPRPGPWRQPPAPRVLAGPGPLHARHIPPDLQHIAYLDLGPVDLNDRRQIVGSYDDVAADATRGFLLDRGRFTIIHVPGARAPKPRGSTTAARSWASTATTTMPSRPPTPPAAGSCWTAAAMCAWTTRRPKEPGVRPQRPRPGGG